MGEHLLRDFDGAEMLEGPEEDMPASSEMREQRNYEGRSKEILNEDWDNNEDNLGTHDMDNQQERPDERLYHDLGALQAFNAAEGDPFTGSDESNPQGQSNTPSNPSFGGVGVYREMVRSVQNHPILGRFGVQEDSSYVGSAGSRFSLNDSMTPNHPTSNTREEISTTYPPLPLYMDQAVPFSFSSPYDNGFQNNLPEQEGTQNHTQMTPWNGHESQNSPDNFYTFPQSPNSFGQALGFGYQANSMQLPPYTNYSNSQYSPHGFANQPNSYAADSPQSFGYSATGSRYTGASFSETQSGHLPAGANDHNSLNLTALPQTEKRPRKPRASRATKKDNGAPGTPRNPAASTNHRPLAEHSPSPRTPGPRSNLYNASTLLRYLMKFRSEELGSQRSPEAVHRIFMAQDDDEREAFEKFAERVEAKFVRSRAASESKRKEHYDKSNPAEQANIRRNLRKLKKLEEDQHVRFDASAKRYRDKEAKKSTQRGKAQGREEEEEEEAEERGESEEYIPKAKRSRRYK